MEYWQPTGWWGKLSVVAPLPFGSSNVHLFQRLTCCDRVESSLSGWCCDNFDISGTFSSVDPYWKMLKNANKADAEFDGVTIEAEDFLLKIAS